MQDIHLIGGGGGRFFIGSGGGDRRIGMHQHHAAAAKCPRCESVNTKFCYYNNYNLSQPRHFCKSCRRYWTKGGVLRNVPVGGGCRKSKRPASKRNSIPVDQEEEEEAAKSSDKPPVISQSAAGKNNSSSSDNSYSSLSASTVEIASTRSPAAVSDLITGVSDSVSAAEAVTERSRLYGNSVTASTSFSGFINGSDDPKVYGNASRVEWTEVIDGLGSASDGGYLPEIGNLTTLIPAPSSETTAFEYGGRNVNQLQENQGGMFDFNYSGRSSFSGNGGFGPLDWMSGNDDQGLFDLPRTVDQTYFCQSQWSRDEGQNSLFP